MKMKAFAGLAAGMVGLGMLGVAHAAPSVYMSQSSFLAALTNPGVDTFDSLAPGAGFNTPLTRSAGAFGYTVSSSTSNGFFSAGNNASDVWLSTNESTDSIIFKSFSGGVKAVGGFFFGTDFAGKFTAAPSIVLTGTDAQGSFTKTFANPSTSSFIGFVNSSPITSLTVSTGNRQNIWATVNDLTLAATIVPSVPEPSSYALFLCGATLVFWARRKAVKTARIDARAPR